MVDALDRRPAAGRRLSPRELATIRAALRLWIETDAALIPDACHVEVGHPGLILNDAEIERLLIGLGLAETVLVCPMNAEADVHGDPRRV